MKEIINPIDEHVHVNEKTVRHDLVVLHDLVPPTTTTNSKNDPDHDVGSSKVMSNVIIQGNSDIPIINKKPRILTAPYYWKRLGTSFQGGLAIDNFTSYYYGVKGLDNPLHVSLSRNGKIIAYGYKIRAGRGSYYIAGAVQVYIYKSFLDKWIKLGPPILDKGYKTSLSADGHTLVIGQWDNEGRANIFHYNSSTNTWDDYGVIENPIQSGPANTKWFGYTTAISDDGGIVAIGQPGKLWEQQYYVGCDDFDLKSAGSVFIYKRQENGSWIQKGNIIVGNDSDHFGYYMSLSDDGLKVAIASDRKFVSVYTFDSDTNSWEQLGPNINGGSSNEVSISSDGLTVALRSTSSSFTKIFSYNNIKNIWEELQFDSSSWVIFSAGMYNNNVINNIISTGSSSDKTRFQMDGGLAVSGDGSTVARTDGVWTLAPVITYGCDVKKPFNCPSAIKLNMSGNLCLESIDFKYVGVKACDDRKNSQLWTVDDNHQYHSVQTPDLCLAKKKNTRAVVLQKCVDGGSALTQFIYQPGKKTLAWRKDNNLVMKKTDDGIYLIKRQGVQQEKWNPVLSQPVCISNIPFQCPSAIQLQLTWGSFCIEPVSLEAGSNVKITKCSSDPLQLFYQDKNNQFRSAQDSSLCLQRSFKMIKLQSCTLNGSTLTRFKYVRSSKKIILASSMNLSNKKYLQVKNDGGVSDGKLVNIDTCSTFCKFAKWMPRVD